MPKKRSRASQQPEDLSGIRRLAEILEVAQEELGPRGTIIHMEMLLIQGLIEAGQPIEGPFPKIERWESMEIHPFSNPTRRGRGMIYDTVSNMRLTPKGRTAFERIAEVATRPPPDREPG